MDGHGLGDEVASIWKWIKIAFVVVFLAGIIIGAMSSMANAEQPGFSSGPPNLAYYAVTEDIRQACPQLNMINIQSKGGISNFGNMGMRNDVQFGLGPLDALMFYNKTNSGKANKLYVVAPMYKNGIQMVASVRSSIKKISDIKSTHKGNIGPKGSGSWIAAQLIGLIANKTFVVSEFSTSDSLKKVMSGELDFAFYFSGVPTPDLQALGKDADGILRLVDMDGLKLPSYYEYTQIPENTYAWEKDAKTYIQVQNYIFVQKGNEELAGQLAACIKDKSDWFEKNGNPVWKGVDLNAEVKWQWSPAAKQALGR